jgi:hypothetical protein
MENVQLVAGKFVVHDAHRAAKRQTIWLTKKTFNFNGINKMQRNFSLKMGKIHYFLCSIVVILS